MITSLTAEDFDKMHDDALLWCYDVLERSIHNKKQQKRKIRKILMKRGALK